MLRAYEVTGLKDYLTIAEESLEFLIGKCKRDRHYSLVGSEGWCVRGGTHAMYDQQPIDACSLVEANWAAFRATRNSSYCEEMSLVYDWFFGANDREIPIYDFESGGCADGLTAEGINHNRGAESTICYLLATLDMIEMSSTVSSEIDSNQSSLASAAKQ